MRERRLSRRRAPRRAEPDFDHGLRPARVRSRPAVWIGQQPFPDTIGLPETSKPVVSPVDQTACVLQVVFQQGLFDGQFFILQKTRQQQ